jgi:hypothetical protein
MENIESFDNPERDGDNSLSHHQEQGSSWYVPVYCIQSRALFLPGLVRDPENAGDIFFIYVTYH